MMDKNELGDFFKNMGLSPQYALPATFHAPDPRLVRYRSEIGVVLRKSHLLQRFRQRFDSSMDWPTLLAALQRALDCWKNDRMEEKKRNKGSRSLFYQYYINSSTGKPEIQGLLPLYFDARRRKSGQTADLFASIKISRKGTATRYVVSTIVTRTIARTNCRILQPNLANHPQLNKRVKSKE